MEEFLAIEIFVSIKSLKLGISKICKYDLCIIISSTSKNYQNVNRLRIVGGELLTDGRTDDGHLSI